MAEPDADSEDPNGQHQLPDGTFSEHLLDAFVYVPAGLALSVAEELPRLAARGRERLGVRVSSARAVGQFAVKAGHDEFVRRSEGLLPWSSGRGEGNGTTPPSEVPATEYVASETRADEPEHSSTTAPSPATSPAPTPTPGPAPVAANGHIPTVGTLSIPGFDALSASQVVQRLDGLNRSELVSVRTYEASNRGRRTILSRVDQLLDERS